MAGQHTDRQERSATFPLIVAATSTGIAVALFFSTTVPALDEHRALRSIDGQRHAQEQALRRELDADTELRMSLRVDPQAILVELDRRGVLPEAIQAGAAPPAPDPAATPGEGRRRGPGGTRPATGDR
jgi:hypothetical protein